MVIEFGAWQARNEDWSVCMWDDGIPRGKVVDCAGEAEAKRLARLLNRHTADTPTLARARQRAAELTCVGF